MTKKYVGLALVTMFLAVGSFAQESVTSEQLTITTSTSYPLRSLDRPSIMPVGAFQMETNASLSNLRTVGVDLAAQFGIVNKLHGMISYDGIKFNDNNSSHPKRILQSRFTVGAKYNYLSIPHLSNSFVMQVPFHVLDGEIVQNLIFGLPVVGYTDNMALFLFHDLIDLKVRPRVEADIKFKIMYGYQITNHIWVDLSSQIARMTLENKLGDDAKFITKGFWQELPLKLSASYSFTNYLDLGANVGFDDILRAKDTMLMGLTFAFRTGV